MHTAAELHGQTVPIKTGDVVRFRDEPDGETFTVQRIDEPDNAGRRMYHIEPRDHIGAHGVLQVFGDNITLVQNGAVKLLKNTLDYWDSGLQRQIHKSSAVLTSRLVRKELGLDVSTTMKWLWSTSSLAPFENGSNKGVKQILERFLHDTFLEHSGEKSRPLDMI